MKHWLAPTLVWGFAIYTVVGRRIMARRWRRR